jgi:hypothetical protein
MRVRHGLRMWCHNVYRETEDNTCYPHEDDGIVCQLSHPCILPPSVVISVDAELRHIILQSISQSIMINHHGRQKCGSSRKSWNA